MPIVVVMGVVAALLVVGGVYYLRRRSKVERASRAWNKRSSEAGIGIGITSAGRGSQAEAVAVPTFYSHDQFGDNKEDPRLAERI